jgi:hypothetical protein
LKRITWNTTLRLDLRETDGTGSISSQMAGSGISELEPTNSANRPNLQTYNWCPDRYLKLASHDYEAIEALQTVPGGKLSILGGRCIGHSKKKKGNYIRTCVLLLTVSEICYFTAM